MWVFSLSLSLCSCILELHCCSFGDTSVGHFRVAEGTCTVHVQHAPPKQDGFWTCYGIFMEQLHLPVQSSTGRLLSVGVQYEIL